MKLLKTRLFRVVTLNNTFYVEVDNIEDAIEIAKTYTRYTLIDVKQLEGTVIRKINLKL